MRRVKKITKLKAETILDKLPKNEVEYLILRIKHAESMVGPHNTSLDKYFLKIAEKLREELFKLQSDKI